MKHAMLCLLFLATSALCYARGPEPGPWDGYHLKSACQTAFAHRDDPSYRSYASGLCLGTVGAIFFVSENFCTPKGYTLGDAVELTLRFMKASPELLNLSGGAVVDLALSRKFPCAK
jgi:hypothetical protein